MQKTLSKDEELLTAQQLRERLQISRTTFDMWRKNAAFPSIKMGPRTERFLLKDVLRFAQKMYAETSTAGK